MKAMAWRQHGEISNSKHGMAAKAAKTRMPREEEKKMAA